MAQCLSTGWARGWARGRPEFDITAGLNQAKVVPCEICVKLILYCGHYTFKWLDSLYWSKGKWFSEVDWIRNRISCFIRSIRKLHNP